MLVQFDISAQEDKLQDANQKANRAADQVRQLLRTNGLDPKDAEVGRFSVQPVYDYKTPKRKLVGYRVDTNISIKLKDFSKVGPITEGLANMADVTGDQSLSYLLDDMEAAKIKAVEDALPRARAKPMRSRASVAVPSANFLMRPSTRTNPRRCIPWFSPNKQVLGRWPLLLPPRPSLEHRKSQSRPM